MIFYRIVTLLYFLYYLSTISNSYVLLYHTKNSPSMQYYDCLYSTRSESSNNIQGIKYCRQLNESRTLQRDFNQSCHNDGKRWSFEELSHRNISASDVLQWSSSLEQADRYSKYLSNASVDVDDNYICNCTNRASFGKFCEYEFYGNSISFDDAIAKQFQARKNVEINVGSQLHNNRPCYTIWTCDSGLMCLDWRHICDGKQQCMDGLDEDHCEVLEFNECEDDEYRCANGMCIPEEYWLDGDVDCMDWTDEMKTLVDSGSDCSDTPSSSCDEHLCPYNQWSCGDGQCINDGTDRHEGTRYKVKSFCKNLRDINYMCEAVSRDSKSWWTINGGYCLPYPIAYQTLGLDPTANMDECEFFLKCALSDSLDKDCQCKNTSSCREMVKYWCNNRSMSYPKAGLLLSPYVSMEYLNDRDWTNKKPDSLGYKGQVKCIGYQFVTNAAWFYKLDETFSFYDYRLSEYRFCNMQEAIYGNRNYSGPHYDVNCWNSSKTFHNHFYQVSFLCNTRCISKYRVRDGIYDCWNEESFFINNSCPEIQHHRFRCSSSELTCLLAGELGNRGSLCFNGHDEFDYESGIILSEQTICGKRADSGCAYFRDYIRISSNNQTKKTRIANSSIPDDSSKTTMPFRSYCNSFFNTKSAIDESSQFCKEWVCSRSEYQCLSGQCISQAWICDGEWDCSDGSDEQRLFIMDHLSEHNSKMINLTEIKQRCSQRYHTNNTPFSNICDISSEYPCFRIDSNDPFNLTLDRPCINLTQIGDGKTDCLSGLDERNLLQCSSLGMLGFHFQFDDGLCGEYSYLCGATYPWTPNTKVDYDTVCFHQAKLFKNGTTSECHSFKDVMCLNDVCIKNARCNGKIECFHGEDEYRCIPQDKSQVNYRGSKIMEQSVILNLENYPYHSINRTYLNKLLTIGERNISLDFPAKYETYNADVKSVYEIVRNSLPTGTITFEEHYLPFICNRGLAVKYYTGDTVCFCPPSFYGSQCEFYSDRITVITHLDLTNYHSSVHQIAVIKVLTTFLFKDQIIDYYEFHVNPQLHNENNYIKQGIYFLYPRIQEFIEMKKNNRSGTQLYRIQFEAFNLHLNETIEPIGVWQYPIYFDFLPAFRLSKILRFHSSIASLSNNPCLSNPCGKNGICQEIINSNRSSYFCSCHSGYYGIDCEDYDEECNNYCSSNSICKPKYRGILTENHHHPLCLCPASTFGNQCYLKNNYCRKSPCLNGGSCVVTYDFADTNNYICVCTDSFTGDHCQFSSGMVNILLAQSSNSTLNISNVVAATVLYSDYHNQSLRFDVRHQQVYTGALLSHLRLVYNQKLVRTAPSIGVLKVYTLNYHNEEPQYHVLYYYPYQKDINITVDLTAENHCPLVQMLWHLVETIDTSQYSDNSTFNSTTAVFFYHRICRAKGFVSTKFTCFRDLNYLCICESDHYRAECFGYNRSLDQCSLCLSNGYCLKGELDDKTDFLCLCPRCHHGKMCQYSTEVMSFTLDSLIVKDIQNNHQASSAVYISIVVFIFLFGFFNNLCSFLTFIRPKPRKFGVGHYLLIVSIVNQCSLLLLLLKVIHIIFGSNGTLFYYDNFNLYSCKIVSYLLSVFTRITYWLTSFVTMERLFMVSFPTSIIMKKPCLSLISSIFVILIVSGMHIHEVLHYTTIIDLSYTTVNVTFCITNYTQLFVSSYNRVNVLIHYFIPFLIQIISITVIVIQTAFSRARTSGSHEQTFAHFFKIQLKKQKEQYVTPIIIVFSALPQSILSFSYACTELNQSWQRYTLLTTYFLSYLPQMLGFILYVLPSSAFSDEFRETVVGKQILKKQQTLTAKQENIEMKTRRAI